MTNIGNVVMEIIEQITQKYPCVNVNQYVIMPNHVHMLLFISHVGVLEKEQTGMGNPSPTVGNVIGWFKYTVTKKINEQRNSVGKLIFQRSFHDHIIRNEKDYEMIWNYIIANPINWCNDCFYTP